MGRNVVQVPRRTVGRVADGGRRAVVFAGRRGASGISQLTGNDDEQQSMLAEGVVRVFAAGDAHTATMETANGGQSPWPPRPS